MQERFDVAQCNPNAINISEIGPEGKFVKFKRFVNKKDPEDVIIETEYKFEFTKFEFTSSNFNCEKLDEKQKQESLKLMLLCLRKHIDKEIEIELMNVKVEITKRLECKYFWDKLNSKLKTSEASQVSKVIQD